MKLPDEERGALFDPAMQYVGIECGCDKMKEESCCFLYADTVEDDPAVEPKGVEVVSKFNCDESTPEWSDDIKGAEHVDDDSGAERSQQETPTESSDTYDQLAKALGERWSMMVGNPRSWANDIHDEDAIMETREVSPHKITVNDDLRWIAGQWEAESSPCNYDVNWDGSSLENFFRGSVERFKQAYFLSYEGEYTKNADEIITKLLAKEEVDRSALLGVYDELGVGCACNSEKGMECLFIFTERMKHRGLHKSHWEERPIVNKQQCEEICRLKIFVD